MYLEQRSSFYFWDVGFGEFRICQYPQTVPEHTAQKYASVCQIFPNNLRYNQRVNSLIQELGSLIRIFYQDNELFLVLFLEESNKKSQLSQMFPDKANITPGGLEAAITHANSTLIHPPSNSEELPKHILLNK